MCTDLESRLKARLSPPPPASRIAGSRVRLPSIFRVIVERETFQRRYLVTHTNKLLFLFFFQVVTHAPIEEDLKIEIASRQTVISQNQPPIAGSLLHEPIT